MRLLSMLVFTVSVVTGVVLFNGPRNSLSAIEQAMAPRSAEMRMQTDSLLREASKLVNGRS